MAVGVSRVRRFRFADPARSAGASSGQLYDQPLQQPARLDADGDGKLLDREANAYLDTEMPSLVEGLRLRAGDEVLPLEVLHRSAEYRSGQGGLPTLRVETHLLADLPKDWRGEAHYADKTYANRLGWREIVVRGGPEMAIRNSTVQA